jgi:hypothetical protein
MEYRRRLSRQTIWMFESRARFIPARCVSNRQICAHLLLYITGYTTAAAAAAVILFYIYPAKTERSGGVSSKGSRGR